MSDMVNQFCDWMNEVECGPANPSEIVADDTKHYVDAADGKRGSKKIRYVLAITPSGFGVGGFVKYDGMGEWHIFRSWPGNDEVLPAKDRKFLAAHREKVKRELQEEHDRAAEIAAEHLRGLPLVTDAHPYLVRKNVRALGEAYLSPSGDILVPARRGEVLSSYQSITPAGKKLFLTGGKSGGTYFPIYTPDDNMGDIVICEGYATGLSIREATGLPVFCAWNDANLYPVTLYVRDQYPGARIIIAADNDAWTFLPGKRPDPNPKYAVPASDPQWEEWRKAKVLTNPGIEWANRSAAAIGGAHVVWPEFDNDLHDLAGFKLTDFNDLMSWCGQDAVRKAFTVIPDKADVDLFEPPISAAPLHTLSDLPAMPDPDWLNKLTLKARNQIDPSSHKNAVLFLENHDNYRGLFAKNIFSDEIWMMRQPPFRTADSTIFKARPYKQTDITRLTGSLEDVGMRLGADRVHQALKEAAEMLSFHPPRDWLLSLEWDGTPRLDTWLRDVCEATTQPAEYLAVIGSCWMIAAAMRLMYPGTPFHHMLVLEGGQAAGKSTLLRNLATMGHDSSEYFSDGLTFAHIGNPNLAQFLQGRVIIEFAELSKLDKRSYEEVKQWITQTDDEIMKKYEAVVTKYPRQFVLAGSTNDSQYLRDPTGNRRFWPVRVGKINNELVVQIKTQLWAEATYRAKAGERWYLKDGDPLYDLVKHEQAGRMLDDVWMDCISEYVATRSHVKTTSVLEECLFIPRAQQDNSKKARVKGVMEVLGYEFRQCRYNGENTRMWVKDGY